MYRVCGCVGMGMEGRRWWLGGWWHMVVPWVMESGCDIGSFDIMSDG